ncbi:MAG: carbamate kinase, partial [Bacteroidales bacterium]|nr:carbamate kinase [Bacteroidales bacterium]
MTQKTALIAFGGNALLRANQQGNIDEQRKNVNETCKSLIPLIKKDYNLIITHGNGPQVGNAMLSNLAGHKLFGLPLMPMDICGSYTQGYIGYIIEQSLRNILQENKIEKEVSTLLTQVVVNKDDKAFEKPTKPVGPYYTEEEKDIFLNQNPEEVYAADPKGKGFRKLVASPVPVEISNLKAIKTLLSDNQIVIAAGGGGIPVYYDENKMLKGVEAVIDKDLASALLASKLNIDKFYILTDVPK